MTSETAGVLRFRMSQIDWQRVVLFMCTVEFAFLPHRDEGCVLTIVLRADARPLACCASLGREQQIATVATLPPNIQWYFFSKGLHRGVIHMCDGSDFSHQAVSQDAA